VADGRGEKQLPVLDRAGLAFHGSKMEWTRGVGILVARISTWQPEWTNGIGIAAVQTSMWLPAQLL